MGAAWTSWRTTISLIITAVRIPALIGAKSDAVSGVDGQTFLFTCEYPSQWASNAKYFCKRGDNHTHLIRTDTHDQWETDGRFSLYDNTTAAIFLVKVERLVLGDSGVYWCGVVLKSQADHISIIELNVSRVNERSNFPSDLTVDKLNMPLFLTAVMCMAAILFVGLFILCLLWAVKGQRSRPTHHRETSSDYETMTLGVGAERVLHCTCSPSDMAAPPDLCSHIRPDSAVNQYSNVDAPVHICPYQDLDVSQLEDHVYQKIHRPKRGALQMNS